MKSKILTRFSAVVLGFKDKLVPSVGTLAEQAWADGAIKTLSEAIRSGGRGCLEPIPPVGESQLSALAAMVAWEGRRASGRIASSLAERLGDDAGGVWVGCNEKRPVILSVDAEGRLTARSALAIAIHGGKPPVSMEDRTVASFFKSPSKFRHLIGQEGGRTFGAASHRMSDWASDDAQGPWAAAIDAYYVAVKSWEQEAERQVEILAVQKVAKLLYPQRPSGLMAAKLRLASIQFGDQSPLKALWNPQATREALDLMDQTPGAASLAAALAPVALGARDVRDRLELEKDFAGKLKRELKAGYYLTDAGWRALAKHSDEMPEFAARLSSALREAKSARIELEDQRAGCRVPLGDGSTPTPGQLAALALCRGVSLCSEQGLDVEDVLAITSPGLVGADLDGDAEDVGWIRLLTHAPLRNRDALREDQWLEVRLGRAARSSVSSRGPDAERHEAALRQRLAWEEMLAREGVGPEPLLSPTAFAKLSEAKWIPSGEMELAFAAMERDRVARFAKGPRVVAAAARRKRELSSAPRQYERESSFVMDMITGVESGFWEQAPDKLGWAWLKSQSDQWHDDVLREKASQEKWTPIEEGRIELPSGWVARELTDGGELHAEGLAMRHCVSSYAKACSTGRMKIFSLTRALGGLKSTVEYRCSYPGGTGLDGAGSPGVPSALGLAQHRGFANSEPSLAAREAERHLLELLREKCAAAWARKKKTGPGP